MWSLPWIVFTVWLGLLVYNLISALSGTTRLTRLYVRLLRFIYRLVNSRRSTSYLSVPVQKDNGTFASSDLPRNKSFRTFRREFQLDDVCDFVRSGVDIIADDEVTKCFSTEEVEEWNFMARTQSQMNPSIKLEILLWLSIVFRFAIFFVIRLPIGISSLIWLVATMVVLSILGFFFPHAQWRRNAERYCCMVCSRLIASTFSAVINVHNAHNRAKCGTVCVANHTTPIDVVMLAIDNCFTLVGQRHGGFTGMIQRACSMAQRHIWFERKVAGDRQMVAARLKEHIADVTNNPILIFPEGTCINNTGVFMFKKGCFELGATIHPAVIKYRREFADPFWNSQEQNMLTYLFMLMTSWAIVCDIYYLEPTTIQDNETAIEFAQRVKADICSKGGLVDLPWDGMIKRPGNESHLRRMIEDERKAYSEALEIRGSDSAETEAVN